MNLVITRREERECTFLTLFESDFNNYNLSEIIENKKVSEENCYFVTKYVEEIFNGVKINQKSIDNLIAKNSLNWDKNRISKVALNLLRLAVYEILFKSDIPHNVSINEAVELAKKYGVETESAFINGILGAICKENEFNLS